MLRQPWLCGYWFGVHWVMAHRCVSQRFAVLHGMFPLEPSTARLGVRFACAVVMLTLGVLAPACGHSSAPSGDSGAVSDSGTSIDAVGPDALGPDGAPVDAPAERPVDASPIQDAFSDSSDASCRDIDAAGPGCPSGNDLCNAPTQCGPLVQSHEMIQAPPTALGGSIMPGLYLLSDVTIYRSQPSRTDTFQFALEVTASTFAQRAYQGGYEDSPMSGTYTTSGTTLHRHVTCSFMYDYTDEYSATATTLTIYRTITGCFAGTYANTYQLQ